MPLDDFAKLFEEGGGAEVGLTLFVRFLIAYTWVRHILLDNDTRGQNRSPKSVTRTSVQ